jgi:Cu-Zn family superoxide dismutase
MRNRIKISLLLLLLFASLTGVAMAQEPLQATADIQDVAGNVIGVATFTEEAEGVRIVVNVTGLEGGGGRGIHIHEVGSCTPDFGAAGEHFNPTGAQHGLDNPSGPHAGDLPNLEVAEDGSAAYEAVNSLITLSEGPNSILDADGSALIIHSDRDDQMTDPTGNSGMRIACGVITLAGAEAMEEQPADDQAAAGDQAETGDQALGNVQEQPADQAAQPEAQPETQQPAAEQQQDVSALPQTGGVNYTPYILLAIGGVFLAGGFVLRYMRSRVLKI